jgi:hypothetical protein
MVYGCEWARKVRNIVFTEWWGRVGDPTPAIAPTFQKLVLCTETKRASSMDNMRRTLNHITSYFIWRMRCGILYSGKKPTPEAIMANNIWNEFETTLKARLSHITEKKKWWGDRAVVGKTPTETAEEALAKLRAETGEVTAVLSGWETPNLIPKDVEESIRKWCWEASVNDADIAALPRPQTFTRWSHKWKLGTHLAPSEVGPSEPTGETVAPPRDQSLSEEGVV